jgi:hypothetical protein
MTSILDICLEQQFRTPTNPREFLALQIARKLGDLDRARDYAVLLEHFPEHIVLSAFQRARARAKLTREGFLEAFQEATAVVREEEFDE